MKSLFSFLAGAICLLLSAAVWAGSHSGRVVMEFDLSAHDPGKEARIWVPYPVSDRYQLISNIEIKGNFDHAAVYTDRNFQTPILYAYWKAGTKGRTLTFSFDVTRQERRNKDLPSKEPCWDPSDYARYLAPTSLGPTSGTVGEFARRITAGKTTVRGKAKAIYDWICDHMHRDPETRGCGNGNVCVLLKSLGGKCADIHSVFVALARAAGVPSREVFGIRQGKEGTTDITKWQHCWAEFYLPGYGWVVVDPADVLKAMLKRDLGPDDPETKRLRDYYWGAVDPYRIRLSYGRDIILNPPHNGGPVNYLMYPFAQVGDITLDCLDPETFRYTITHYSR